MIETLSAIFPIIRELATAGSVVVSGHAYERLQENGIKAVDVAAGAVDAILVEDYPDWHKGPSLLALQRDENGQPIHVMWGLRPGTTEPAFIVTVYRPDPRLWSDGFKVRK